MYIRSSLITLLLLLIFWPTQALAQTPPQPSGAGGTWDLVFADEFNTSSLDTTKWSVCYPWDCHSGGNGELMVYDPKYIKTESGNLVITADNTRTCDGSYCADYGSGLIQTGIPIGGSTPKFMLKYGFVEGRIQVPYGTGYFPAFWLRGSPGEIDLMEVFGNNTWFSCGAHSPEWSCPHFGSNTPGSWHTFGVDWEPNVMTFYFDGQVTSTTTDPQKIPSDEMRLLVNFAVGANFIPPPDSTTVFPAQMKVDYVRVWKKNTATASPKPQCSPADINQDGIVDLTDYSLLARDFFHTTLQNPRSDINEDGVVDITDYSRLAASFFTSTGPCQ